MPTEYQRERADEVQGIRDSAFAKRRQADRSETVERTKTSRAKAPGAPEEEDDE